MMWKLEPHCRWHSWGEETTVFHAISGDLFLFNHLAGLILSQLELRRCEMSAQEVADVVKYLDGETVSTDDLQETLDHLQERGLICTVHD